MQNLFKIHWFVLELLSRNGILTSIKDHNSVNHLGKLICINPSLDIVNINAYAKFGQNPSIRSEDIERKRNSDVNQGQQLYNKSTKIDAQQSQPRSCQYQCICKIWSNSINLFSGYWAETKSEWRNQGMTDNLKTVYSPPILRMQGYENGFWWNFAYELILTRTWLALLDVNFHHSKAEMALDCVRIVIPLYIFETEIMDFDQILHIF